jgi:hypothetical protein
MFIEFVSVGDPSRRMCDDGVEMHEYLFSTVVDCLLVILRTCLWNM